VTTLITAAEETNFELTEKHFGPQACGILGFNAKGKTEGVVEKN